MPFDPDVHVGVAAFIERNDKLLLMKRSDNATHGQGTWALPGGWVDQGETTKHAVVREIEEEIGVVTDETYVTELLDVVTNHYFEHGTVVCVIYRVELDADHVPVNLEPSKVSKLEWVPKEFVYHARGRIKLFPALDNLLFNQPQLLQ